MSLKTSRSRFKIMGLTPPEGMGEADRVCAKCLKKIHSEEMKRIRIIQLKSKLQKDLIKQTNGELKSNPNRQTK